MSHFLDKNPNIFQNNLLKYEEALTHFKIENLSQKQIEDLNIPLQPNKDTEKFENSSIILIRHALSIANFQHKILDYLKKQPNTNQDYLDYLQHYYVEERLNLENVNCRLHYLGIQQCINQQKYINNIDFQVVFISPFTRVLQTVEYLFQNHPKLDQLKFVVIPHISEGMGYTTSIQEDSHKDIQNLKKKLNINIDDSIFQQVYDKNYPYFWNYTLLTQPERKQKAEQIRQKSKNYEEFLQNMIEQIKEISPEKFENKQGQYERGNIAREIMKDYLLKNNIMPNKNQKIAIISHAVFLYCFNCDRIDGDSYIGGSTPSNAGLLGFENDLIFDHKNHHYQNQKLQKNQEKNQQLQQQQKPQQDTKPEELDTKQKNQNLSDLETEIVKQNENITQQSEQSTSNSLLN
ncbi:hypothetical protein PPERSA_08628 [Pseudocohnilembus persalinus]|uniref:Uncharacterized protein n=1 Tax=Pseudocohnilembus persalinus TaxID=266149 RepID=A0A0V0R547_PSEPJ|nr:hypothetical protein PPERSA_08628 [Pseudocohnilembus persalinus]|eukprot:KRX09596.1 hypothetical protein PPERSA_08628 [Pseudocohnilembus persalinus]